MGNLEKGNLKRRKRKHLQKIVLGTVKAAGVLGIAVLAPNVIRAMKSLGLMPNRRQGEYTSSSASKLAKKGLLRFENNHYSITLLGEKILRKWDIEDYKLARPKKWDKQWRMIIFDIPEKKKGVRAQITTLFNKAGLYRLQDSVWVYPYDCEEIIGLMKTDYKVGKEVLYVIADSIENDKHLRREFGLA